MSNKLDGAIVLEAGQGPGTHNLGEGALVWEVQGGAGRAALFAGMGNPNGYAPSVWNDAGLANNGTALYIRQDSAGANTALWVTSDGGTTWVNVVP